MALRSVSIWTSGFLVCAPHDPVDWYLGSEITSLQFLLEVISGSRRYSKPLGKGAFTDLND